MKIYLYYTLTDNEILRYIATLKQAKIAMGDLANTINKSVAYIRNYVMKKLVNLYKKGVRMVKNFNSI